MYRLMIVVFGILVCMSTISAQDTLAHRRDWGITWSYSALLNEYPGLQFGIEKRLGKYTMLQSDLAYLYQIDTEFYPHDFQGFRIKNGIKYMNMEHQGYLNIRWYVVANLLIRYTSENKTEDLRRLDGAFFQRLSYTRSRFLIGPAIGFGTEQYSLDRFIIQTGFSFGYGYMKVVADGLPDDANPGRTRVFQEHDRTGNHLYPIFSLSTKIIFAL